jgi:hypothetical protein
MSLQTMCIVQMALSNFLNPEKYNGTRKCKEEQNRLNFSVVGICSTLYLSTKTAILAICLSSLSLSSLGVALSKLASKGA